MLYITVIYIICQILKESRVELIFYIAKTKHVARIGFLKLLQSDQKQK